MEYIVYICWYIIAILNIAYVLQFVIQLFNSIWKFSLVAYLALRFLEAVRFRLVNIDWVAAQENDIGNVTTMWAFFYIHFD